MRQNVSIEVGGHIREFRKLRKITLNELSDMIFKSPSTISKYENGEISIDVATLYDIAAALNVRVEQLLSYRKQSRVEQDEAVGLPQFFRNDSQIFMYIYDGRTHNVMQCVLDIFSKDEDDRFNAMLYMNYQNYSSYRNCENTFKGYLEHFHAMTICHMQNLNTPMGSALIQILSPFVDSNEKWGLFTCFSVRPIMPIATKVLFSKLPLPINDDLIARLKISKEDVRQMKMYNMFCVM